MIFDIANDVNIKFSYDKELNNEIEVEKDILIHFLINQIIKYFTYIKNLN